ncbi:sigma 54-interacting transcriptional regulator [Ruficoccus sp. ZRK36]|uniref:sigma 54-interacting transcriptional regulator n=1 Tax=Ruficoccus sp. ZRK36 TaxID=2866311 RepID=UPI001C7336F6|nr:sigma 54-interacting transcriptional regulator [Ruficoccus sp. ZRK36]QYY35680.1 sigma 54-interacting transcriptional regulator [Ruficoccus sp. ZRK36]
MAGNLFPKATTDQARAYAQLAFLNPFEAQRFEIESEVLTDKEQELRGLPRLEAVLAGLDRLLESAHLAYAAGRGRASEREHYQQMVFVRLFHRFIPDFDKIIEEAHERGHAALRAGFFDRFQREAEAALPGGLIGRYAGMELERLFAVFFQIRRAYVHIERYIIGQSPVANSLRARIWQSIFTHDMDRYQRVLADRMGDVITLITGPSGSGKELVARGVGLSRYIPFDPNTRSFTEDFVKAFYPINLSALSPTLIESELFGHRRGAFTGALQNRQGYFETCGPFGTVFLDEIGETDPGIQVKLLRVLQTRQFVPIGETDPKTFTGKLMAATNRDLPTEIQAGRFREDFYFRLNADRIRTPSLREILNGSPRELETLVAYIARKFAGPKEGAKLTDEVCTTISQKLPADYQWPGNFRELEQCVRNITVHGDYQPEDLSAPAAGEGIAGPWARGELTAEQLLARYVAEQYARIPNYEELGRRLQLDRRTVKKYLQISGDA